MIVINHFMMLNCGIAVHNRGFDVPDFERERHIAAAANEGL